MTRRRSRAQRRCGSSGITWTNDQEKVEKHLSFCRNCCGELEFAKEMRVILATSTVEEIPPHVRERLERFVEGL